MTKKYLVEYLLTEVTKQAILVTAESPEQAEELVKSYEFNNEGAWEVGSYEWEVSDVECIEEVSDD